MEKIHLSRLGSDLASSFLAGCERLDPRGLATARDVPAIAAAGSCFLATSDDGAQAVFVVEVANGVAWISACKGTGQVKWREVLLPVVELQAKGLAAVGFQTKRRGLVRAAQRQGYEVAGWIMKKKLQ